MNHPEFVAQCIEELREKIEFHNRLWHLDEANWSVDQAAGEIVFSAPNGIVATCSVQIVGTFDTNDSTWLWAWDHPWVREALCTHASRLREYGEKNGIAELTTRKIFTTENRCWEFTALACTLNNAQGGYRGPTGNALAFMTFDELKLTGSPTVNSSKPSLNINCEALTDFNSDIPTDVRSTLSGFMTALHDWEVASHQACQTDEANELSAAMDNAQNAYNALLREWCVPELTPQPISFGSDPSHHPETERLVGAAATEGKYRVRTQYADSSGFTSDYEYHLRHQGGKWLVENAFYVDDGGKYEIL
jgi:hypothetical protein